MRDLLIAAIRTGVQALIGLFATVPWLDGLGINNELETVLVAVGVGVVTLVLRWLEEKLPWLTVVLSLGTSKTGPSYTP